MRAARVLILIVLAFAWLAVVPGQKSSAAEDASGAWRYTTHGWERLNLYGPEIEYRRPAIHPTLVGGLEILAIALAMSVGRATLRDDPAREMS